MVVPEGEGEELAVRDERELRMPERIAIPRVPTRLSISAYFGLLCLVKLAASQDCQGHPVFGSPIGVAIVAIDVNSEATGRRMIYCHH